MGTRLHTVALLLAFASPACSDSKKTQKPDAKPAVRAQGLEGGDEQLAQAMREVFERCQVSETGRVTACPSNEDRAFRKLERSVGIRAALTTYCHGLADVRPEAQAMSGAGLSRLAYYRSMYHAKDPDLLDCMLDLLRKSSTKKQRAVRPLTRAAAYLATALERERLLLPLLKKTKLATLKEAGYGALWANGRLRVLEALSQVINDDKTPVGVRVAAINGFAQGGRLLPREQEQVCKLLSPLLTARLPVASAAAKRAAESCPPLKDRVLQAAEALAKKGNLDPVYVSAVRAVDGDPPATEEQRNRIVALLTAVVGDSRFTGATRAAALSKIGWISRRLSIKLARQQLESATGPLRQSAEWILGSTGKKK